MSNRYTRPSSPSEAHADKAPEASGYILVAVSDDVLRSEGSHAAAATSFEVLHAEDPRDIVRLSRGAAAVLVDAATAPILAGGDERLPSVFFLAPDPGPIDYEAALKCHAEQAFIMPAQSQDLLAALSEVSRGAAARRRSPEGGACIAVAGVCGGLGASTLAASIARARGRALLVDAAPRSGGLDLLLGLESDPGARWPDLHFGEGSIDPQDLRRALPMTGDAVVVLSQARATALPAFTVTEKHVRRVIEAMRAAEEITVVDCDVAGIPEQCDFAVLVTAAEVRPVAVAAQCALELNKRRIRYGVVLRHRQWAGLSVDEVERITHAGVLAQIPTVHGLVRQVETGGLPQRLPAPLQKAAQAVLTAAEQE